jgi:hypothetical protein
MWRICIVYGNEGNGKISEVKQIESVLFASELLTSDLIMMEKQSTLHLFTVQ